MKPQYYVLDDCYIAKNPKVVSEGLGMSVSHSHGIEGAEHMMYRFLAPTTETPDKRVLLLMRDPVERFVSAAAQLKCGTVAEAFDDLEDEHFIPQVAFTRSGQPTQIYRYPDELERLCDDAGIETPPVTNKAVKKLSPTADDIARMRCVFPDDFKLWESL